jgi:hypothetical protein
MTSGALWSDLRKPLESFHLRDNTLPLAGGRVDLGEDLALRMRTIHADLTELRASRGVAGPPGDRSAYR